MLLVGAYSQDSTPALQSIVMLTSYSTTGLSSDGKDCVWIPIIRCVARLVKYWFLQKGTLIGVWFALINIHANHNLHFIYASECSAHLSNKTHMASFWQFVCPPHLLLVVSFAHLCYQILWYIKGAAKVSQYINISPSSKVSPNDLQKHS